MKNYDSNKDLDFFKIFGNTFEGSVLDIGCNEGIIGEKIKCGSYIGLDIDKDSLKKAREKGLFVEEFNAESDEIPIADTILCLDIIEHLKNPLDFLERLKASSPKKIIISIPNDYNLMNFIRMFFFNKSIKFESDLGNPYGHLNFWTIKNTKEILSRYFNIKNIYYKSSKFSQPIRSNNIDKFLLWVSPRLFSHTVFIELK